MNTTYAKSKIEKLMAINTCKTANQNEAQTAFDMARKVAEKYKVLTWFYLTYVNPVNIPSEPEVKVEPKVIRNEYDLCEEFRWPDICNVLFDLFRDEFASYLCQYSSRNGDYKHVYFTLSDDEFEFMKKAYKFVLKAKTVSAKKLMPMIESNISYLNTPLKMDSMILKLNITLKPLSMQENQDLNFVRCMRNLKWGANHTP